MYVRTHHTGLPHSSFIHSLTCSTYTEPLLHASKEARHGGQGEIGAWASVTDGSRIEERSQWPGVSDGSRDGAVAGVGTSGTMAVWGESRWVKIVSIGELSPRGRNSSDTCECINFFNFHSNHMGEALLLSSVPE